MTQQSELPLAGVPMPSEGESPRRLPWATTWLLLISLTAVLNALFVFLCKGREGFFLPLLAAMVCLLAALFDASTRRIPNYLTYTAILLGVGLNGLTPLLNLLHAPVAAMWLGAVGPKDSLLGFLVCGGLGLLAMLTAGVHGGDLKLLAAIGAILGMATAGSVTFLALLIALIYAVVNLIFFGRLNAVLQIAAHRVLELVYLRRLHTPLPEDSVRRASHIPMAIPMALAMAIAEIWHLRTGGSVL